MTNREIRIEWIEKEIRLIIESNITRSNRITEDNKLIARTLCTIQELNKELVVLKAELAALQAPKYTAKDFPCLDWTEFGITYYNAPHKYHLRTEIKLVESMFSQEHQKIIDEHVEITPCKLSDIQVGDYFALYDTENPIITDYRYCTNIDFNTLYYDYGDAGYIKQETLSRNIEIDSIYVKFTQKDK